MISIVLPSLVTTDHPSGHGHTAPVEALARQIEAAKLPIDPRRRRAPKKFNIVG
jgi:hypothetical protein